MKYYNGRQSTSYNCGNTPTADRVHDAAGRCTLTGDRVLATIAETLRRPTEYPILQDRVLSRATECLLRLRKYSDDRQSTRCYGMKYYNGRQSTRCDRIKYFDGRQSTCHNCGNTLTADRVLYPVAAYPFLARIGYASQKYAKGAAHTMPRLRI